MKRLFIHSALLIAGFCMVANMLVGTCSTTMAQSAQVQTQPKTQGFYQGQNQGQGQNYSKTSQQRFQQYHKTFSVDGYYSPKLRAKLLLERMTIPGFTFWGARIVEMDSNSPLHQAGLHLGDVITRLDGVRINTGKYWVGRYWSLPQAERHFGHTEVRHIHTGQTRVENTHVDLGSSWSPHHNHPPNNIIVP